MNKVTVGMIGTGFAAAIHGEAYRRVHSLEVRLKAVSSLAPDGAAFAEKYGFETFCPDYHELLRDPEIDVVDIITPPVAHRQMILDALAAGKHVICEKPLTGYFGEKGADENGVGKTSKRLMYDRVSAELEELRQAVEKSGKLFMYAENFCYAPAVLKTAQLVRAKGSKILYMRAEEGHSGSHAHHAARWCFNGGGSFIRQGCHPLSAALYLKGAEAANRNESVSLVSVMADVGVTQACLTESEKKNILARPVDVEDQASVLLTFSDGTKANITAGDFVLGGVRNVVEVYTNDGSYINSIAPNNHLMAYDVTDEGLEDVYITEKVETKAGWQPVFIDEDFARGYVGEMQDFMECVATGREPLSGFRLAYDTAKAIYAAYWSAEEGVRVNI